MNLEFDSPAANISRVILDGRLDIVGANEIDLRFSTWAAAQNSPVLIDLEKVSFISSMGIRLLLGAAQALKRKQIFCCVLAPQPLVKEVLDLAGMTELLQVQPDLVAAITAAS